MGPDLCCNAVMAATEKHEKLAGWFAGQVPEDWFTAPPDVTADRDEILVVGSLPEPKLDKGSGPEAVEAARRSRIQRFREDTRDHRMRIAADAEARTRRRVSWGAQCGDVRELFTIENSSQPPLAYVDPKGTFRFHVSPDVSQSEVAVKGLMDA